MASTISKTTITFVVLHRTDEPLDNFVQHGDGPLDNSLGEALSRSWDGHAVGSIVTEVTEEIADEDVPDELSELGNDGEFFDDDLYDPEDDEDDEADEDED